MWWPLPKDLLHTLAETGILGKLDALFFSHTHADHYGQTAMKHDHYAPYLAAFRPSETEGGN